MKNLIALAVMVVLISAYTIPGFIITSIYDRYGRIVEINGDENLVEDLSGNLWAFRADSFQVGDVVKMRMYNNNTPRNIYDDVILKVR